MIILLKAYNTISCVYSLLLVVMLMTMQNISIFAGDYQDFTNTDQATKSVEMIIVAHSCLLIVQVILLVWLLGRNLKSIPVFGGEATFSLRVTVPALVYLTLTITGIVIFVKYSKDYSSFGSFVFGILSLIVFILAKSDCGDFYVSVLPGLVMCIGWSTPALDAFVYEKSSSTYTSLALPVIYGVAAVLLAQFAALLHCAAIVVINTDSSKQASVPSGEWGNYNEIAFERPDEGDEAEAQLLPDTNVGNINDDQ